MAEKRTLDMTDVKDGAYTRKNVDEGEYAATITAVNDAVAKDDTDMWVLTVKLDGVSRATYPYYLKLDAKNLWKVSMVFKVVGSPLPKKRGAVDPNKLIGKSLGVSMVDDEYNGRLNSTIDDIFSANELKTSAPATIETGDEIEVIDEPVADTFEDDDLSLDLDEE